MDMFHGRDRQLHYTGSPGEGLKTHKFKVERVFDAFQIMEKILMIKSVMNLCFYLKFLWIITLEEQVGFIMQFTL